MNKALPVPDDRVEDIGLRTDILYHCEVQTPDTGGKLNINAMRCAGLQWLASPHNRGDALSAWARFTKPFAMFAKAHGLPLHIPSHKHYRELSRRVGHPNCGTSAIVDLLQHGVGSLHVTGMTFMRTGYDQAYRPFKDDAALRKHLGKWTSHNFDKQVAYMAHLAKSEPRLTFDAAGMEALS